MLASLSETVVKLAESMTPLIRSTSTSAFGKGAKPDAFGTDTRRMFRSASRVAVDRAVINADSVGV
jgi:hypothetical protein